MRYQFQVILEWDEEDGGYIVSVPALPGCVTQGDTREEALKMAEDAIRGYIESLRKHNEPLPFSLDKAEVETITVDVA